MTDSFIVESGVVSVEVVQSNVVSVEVQSPPAVNSVLVRGPQGIPGPGVEIRVQTLSADGITDAFQLDTPAVSNASVQVFRNGLAEIAGVGFTITSDNEDTVVSFSAVPLADDEVQVVYQV